MVLYILTLILALSSLTLLVQANRAVSVITPAPGGTLTEGVVGAPRFINPLLAISQTDRDLTALVYSGLMRQLPNGTMVTDLAESFEILEDGTTYIFKIRKNATFHDGRPVTSADVGYTIQLAQKPSIKSVQRANWDGVEVSMPDPQTIQFKLPHPYAPFLNNTTLGILPKHLWQNVSDESFAFDQQNTRPVGSGPYKIGEIENDRNGTPVRYTLDRFGGFTIQAPYLSHIVFSFFPNQEALIRAMDTGNVESVAAITPISLTGSAVKRSRILKEPLERVFAVFFNQNHNAILADTSVRKALNAAIDKEKIVDSVLRGYGEVLSGPFPASMFGTPASASSTPSSHTDEARAILEKGGWRFDTQDGTWSKGGKKLSLTISTSDADQLVATAEAVAADWRKLGVGVHVQVYSLSELNESVIRPRQYDAVLFGEVVGPALDLFAFWHSSQRIDPGLNLSLYANTKADTALEEARREQNDSAREKLYNQFTSLLAEDMPAAFLYAPDLVYVVPQRLHGASVGSVTIPSDRFAAVYEWYVEKQRVWEVFAR